MSIDYSIRVSQRARRLQIKISPMGEVEVVIPEGMAAYHVAPFVEKHHRWIQQTKSRLFVGLAEYSSNFACLLPENIVLKVIGGDWSVAYKLRPGLRSSLVESESLLQINAPDELVARQVLQRWLSRKARRYLLPLLCQWSDETGLRFQRLTIRAQKTRWGSCSSIGTISLNRALMFLDQELVRYLIIHELCHLRHMNHSRHFWALVGSFDHEYRDAERRLKCIAPIIPAWVFNAAHC